MNLYQPNEDSCMVEWLAMFVLGRKDRLSLGMFLHRILS
jgi:hypothetical protein